MILVDSWLGLTEDSKTTDSWYELFRDGWL